MNLTLYSVDAFLILDSEGHRVLAKYYRAKDPKDQRTFEKGLWQKTKKPGGTVQQHLSLVVVLTHARRRHSLRRPSRRVPPLPRPRLLCRRRAL